MSKLRYDRIKAVTLFSEPHPSARRDDVNLTWLGRLLWSRRRFITFALGVIVGLTAVVLLFIPNRYRSEASILPSQQPTELSDIKNLMGIPSLDPGIESSSALYPVVLRSRQVKDEVLQTAYEFADGDETRRVTLPNYLDEDVPEHLYQGLDKMLEIDVDSKTGVIRVSVETRYAGLSQAVLTQFLNALEQVNRSKRTSKASDNARYLSEQLTAQTKDLEVAEDSLEMFRIANRNWSNTTSPEIVKEEQRLTRRIELKTTTVAYLTQQFEAAKFEAQKNTPMLRILDEPSLPRLKSGPFRMVILAAISFLGLLIICGMTILLDPLAKARNLQPPWKHLFGQEDGAGRPLRMLRFIRKHSRSENGLHRGATHPQEGEAEKVEPASE